MKRGKKRFRPIGWFMNFSLAKKLLFLYLLIVLFPISAFGAFYFNGAVAQLNLQHRESKEMLLRQSLQSLQNNLSQIEYCANSFQSSSSVRDYVENEDLSNGQGVYLYLTGVQSAFEVARGSNPFIDSVCIYRKLPRSMNDPANVRNEEDSPYLENMQEAPQVTGLTLLLDLEQPGGKCVVFKTLYSDKYYREIGTTELVCGVDFMFSPLHFVEDDEFILLELRGKSYRICHGPGEDVLLIQEFSGDPANCPNLASISLDAVEAEINYYYPNLHISLHQSFGTIFFLFAAILLFFSLIYYLIYLSITKRITGLTRHIIEMSPENPAPYQKDGVLYQDEIGELTYQFNEMVEQVDSLINQSYRQEKLVQQAQYYAMESQITPHFLYNTLESINMLIELEEYERASTMLTLFGKFLRYNISWKTEETTLKNELDHVRDYLELYSCRMGERFQYKIEAGGTCLAVRCPYCMLQPIAENSFKHGFRNSVGDVYVHIRAFPEDDAIVIEVEDNGKGVTAEEREKLNRSFDAEEKEPVPAQVGLNNVDSRIKLLYGPEYGLRLMETESGYRIRIRIDGRKRADEEV